MVMMVFTRQPETRKTAEKQPNSHHTSMAIMEIGQLSWGPQQRRNSKEWAGMGGERKKRGPGKHICIRF